MGEKRNEERQFSASKVSKFVQFGSERTVHSSCKTYVVGTPCGGDPHTRPRSAIHSNQALKSIPRGKEITHPSKIQVEIDLNKKTLLWSSFSCLQMSNFEFANAFRRQFWSLMRSNFGLKKPHTLFGYLIMKKFVN